MNESYDSNGQSEYDFTVCLCSIHHEDAKNKSNHSFCEETDSLSPIRNARRNSMKTSTASLMNPEYSATLIHKEIIHTTK